MNEAELLQQLADRHLTLGSCESVTGGLFGANICQVPGASNVYLGGLITYTAKEKAKSVFFSKLIIITALVPIFSFQKVEGKMFSPLAFTLGFALLGALVFTLTLVPVLSSILLRKDVRERHNPFLAWVNQWAS